MLSLYVYMLSSIPLVFFKNYIYYQHVNLGNSSKSTTETGLE